jgi:hypothetical protein
MTLVHVKQNRGSTRNIVIQDVDGNTITPAAADLVRATIQREGETPKLTVVSGTPTANGSSITAGATSVLRLDASDLDFEPGVYMLILDLFDNSDSQEWKNIDRQTLFLEGE